MEYNKQIEELTDLVRQYYKIDVTNTSNGDKLNELVSKISALFFYLTSVRVYFHELHNYEVLSLMKEKDENGKNIAFNRAEIMADEKYPELYKLRYLMDATKDLIQTMRTNISYIKKERELSITN